jgi:hypothetical protein
VNSRTWRCICGKCSTMPTSATAQPRSTSDGISVMALRILVMSSSCSKVPLVPRSKPSKKSYAGSRRPTSSVSFGACSVGCHKDLDVLLTIPTQFAALPDENFARMAVKHGRCVGLARAEQDSSTSRQVSMLVSSSRHAMSGSVAAVSALITLLQSMRSVWSSCTQAVWGSDERTRSASQT